MDTAWDQSSQSTERAEWDTESFGVDAEVTHLRSQASPGQSVHSRKPLSYLNDQWNSL